MKLVEMKEATASLAAYARKVASEPVIITRAGRPFAALFSVANIDAENVCLSSNPRLLAILERSWARLKSEGPVSEADMRRRFKAKR